MTVSRRSSSALFALLGGAALLVVLSVWWGPFGRSAGVTVLGGGVAGDAGPSGVGGSASTGIPSGNVAAVGSTAGRGRATASWMRTVGGRGSSLAEGPSSVTSVVFASSSASSMPAWVDPSGS